LQTIELACKVPKGTGDVILNRQLQEAEIRGAIDHPHIVPLYGISLDFDQPRKPCLIFPYYRNGNIIRYITNHPTVNKFLLIAQIAGALAYLHQLSIVHGDIKGSNILINDKLEASVTDFVQSRTLEKSSSTHKFAEVGYVPIMTEGWRWRAPEQMGGQTDTEEGSLPCVTTATDVWAFAMTVIEIFTGCVPFHEIKNDARVLFTVVKGGRPMRLHCPHLSENIWVMLEKCWDIDPDRRPSMNALWRFFELQSTTQLARL